MKKLQSPVLLALLLSATSALADGSNSNPTVTYSCQPSKTLSSPLPVKWDRLLNVISVEGDWTQVTLKSRIFKSFENAEFEVTDSFVPGPSPSGSMMTLTQNLNSDGLSYNAALFQITDLTLPPSAGPVPPGTFPGKATLILISESRSEANAPLEAHVAEIPLQCSFTFAYPTSGSDSE